MTVDQSIRKNLPNTTVGRGGGVLCGRRFMQAANRNLQKNENDTDYTEQSGYKTQSTHHHVKIWLKPLYRQHHQGQKYQEDANKSYHFSLQFGARQAICGYLTLLPFLSQVFQIIYSGSSRHELFGYTILEFSNTEIIVLSRPHLLSRHLQARSRVPQIYHFSQRLHYVWLAVLL